MLFKRLQCNIQKLRLYLEVMDLFLKQCILFEWQGRFKAKKIANFVSMGIEANCEKKENKSTQEHMQTQIIIT